MTTLPKTLRAGLTGLLVATAAAPVLAGPFNRNAATDYIADSGTIYVGDIYSYDFLGYGGRHAYVELGSAQGRADLDVVVYDDRGEVVASGVSGFSEESLSWYVNRDTLYYIEVTSFEGTVTDFYVEAWTEGSH